MKKRKLVWAIIKNDAGQVCHRIKDVVQMALGRNEMLETTKQYIRENYADYTVEFELK